MWCEPYVCNVDINMCLSYNFFGLLSSFLFAYLPISLGWMFLCGCGCMYPGHVFYKRTNKLCYEHKSWALWHIKIGYLKIELRGATKWNNIPAMSISRFFVRCIVTVSAKINCLQYFRFTCSSHIVGRKKKLSHNGERRKWCTIKMPHALERERMLQVWRSKWQWRKRTRDRK